MIIVYIFSDKIRKKQKAQSVLNAKVSQGSCYRDTEVPQVHMLQVQHQAEENGPWLNKVEMRTRRAAPEHSAEGHM